VLTRPLAFDQMLSKYAKGISLSFAGILILTPDTPLLRLLAEVSPDLTVLFWRCTISAMSVLLMMLPLGGFRRTGKAFRGMGPYGITAGLLWGVSNFFFTLAVQNTAAANVLVINASNTVFSSIFAYFLLGEPIPLRTAATILVCFGAIVLVFSSQLTGGADGLAGNFYALAAAATLGLYLPLCRYKSIKSSPSTVASAASADVALESQRELDDILEVMGYNVIAGLTVTVISAGMGAKTAAVNSQAVTLLLIDGILVLGVSFCLLSIGPLYIPAPEVSLMFLVETLLGPVWVWLAGFERPPEYTVYGGAAMILALATNSFLALREERRLQAAQHGLPGSSGAVSPAPGGMADPALESAHGKHQQEMLGVVPATA
jgi:drug/metabolite transporter (DMT)-like permease